jgi:HSP20 family protein
MPAVIRWSPARELVRLSDAMDRMLDESWTRPAFPARADREFRLPLDVYTTPSEIMLSANVPGLKPEEVEVTLEGDTLTIRGEFKPPMENVDYIFQERPYGKFARTLTINVPVNNDKVEAAFENGVLTITLPKAEAARPKTIKVEAKK